MILAFDTYYFDDKAKTVCVAFDDIEQHEPTCIYSEIKTDIKPYVSGEFYRRELPCILSLLKQIDVETIDAIIIDGFVFLDDNNKLGLGGYLYNELQQSIPIIGVAKKDFVTINKNRKEVLRGKSQTPLYITSVGINMSLASEYIAQMHGDYRMPTLLKTVDRLTRE